MQLLGHLIVRLVAIILGIFIAMLAASIFLSFGMFSGLIGEFFADLQLAVNDDPYQEAFDASPIITLLVIAIGFFTSFHVMSLALLPTFLIICLAEAMRWRGLTINLVMGSVVALATGLSVFSGQGGEGLPSNNTLTILLAMGFIGGFFYWLIAGRGAGKWLDQISSKSIDARE